MKKSLCRIIKYVIIGFFTTLVNIVVYWITAVPLGQDYRIATTIAWIAAILFAYVTNKKYVFESITSTRFEFLAEIGLFIGFRFLSFLMDLGVMIVLVSGMNMNGTWAKIWSNLVVLIANYVFSKWFVFRKQNNSREYPL